MNTKHDYNTWEREQMLQKNTFFVISKKFKVRFDCIDKNGE